MTRRCRLVLVAFVIILVGFTISHLRETKELESKFRAVGRLTSDEIDELRKFLNHEHLLAAHEYGVAVSGTDELVGNLAESSLIRIHANQFFKLSPMSYSEPYLIPAAAQQLDSLGARFHEALVEKGLPRFKFFVSSVLRSREDQEALRDGNPNAADVSSHMFGTSVDIYYGEFRYPDLFFSEVWSELHRIACRDDSLQLLDQRLPPWNCQQMAFKYVQEIKAVLGRTLIKLQREGKLMVIHEKGKRVFHVTLVGPVTKE